jgi:peptide/nickel transport system substrate-binding protein
MKDFGAHPFPGTGPYRVVAFHPGGPLTLARNTHFHQWSSAAQPAGYPDEIKWVQTATTEDSVTAVEAGRADVAYPDESSVAALSRGDAGRLLRVVSNTFMFYVVLRVNRPPFDNPTARRAVAYALDRRRLAALTEAGPWTCSIVPPNFPGHPRAPCAYETNLAAARRLVAASGTKGATVDLLWLKDPVKFVRVAEYVGGVLSKLGYHVRRHNVPFDQYIRESGDPKSMVNVLGNGFGPDYPAASNFYDFLLSCAAAGLPSEGTSNYPGGCNRSIDRIARQAYAAESTDPGRALRLWKTVYALSDQDAAIIATNTGEDITLVSARVGNFQSTYLVDQLWVR